VVVCAVQDGWTPLHFATNKEHTAVVEALLAAGADVTITPAATPSTDEDEDGYYEEHDGDEEGKDEQDGDEEREDESDEDEEHDGDEEGKDEQDGDEEREDESDEDEEHYGDEEGNDEQEDGDEEREEEGEEHYGDEASEEASEEEDETQVEDTEAEEEVAPTQAETVEAEVHSRTGCGLRVARERERNINTDHVPPLSTPREGGARRKGHPVHPCFVHLTLAERASCVQGAHGAPAQDGGGGGGGKGRAQH
jgi:hypothetical protein